MLCFIFVGLGFAGDGLFCYDVTAPKLTCPAGITLPAEPSQGYARPGRFTAAGFHAVLAVVAPIIPVLPGVPRVRMEECIPGGTRQNDGWKLG